MCLKAWDRKFKRLASEEMRSGAEAALCQAYRCHLFMVSSFKYLGMVLTAADGDCTAVAYNLSKSKKQWAKMLRTLGREGENAVSGLFYKSMVQPVLLYR